MLPGVNLEPLICLTRALFPCTIVGKPLATKLVATIAPMNPPIMPPIVCAPKFVSEATHAHDFASTVACDLLGIREDH
jgi:hypothetical protein